MDEKGDACSALGEIAINARSVPDTGPFAAGRPAVRREGRGRSRGRGGIDCPPKYVPILDAFLTWCIEFIIVIVN